MIRTKLPKLKIVDKLPEWITSSDEAAYHPYSKTIWLRKDRKIWIFHELGHYFIDIFGEVKEGFKIITIFSLIRS